MGWRWWTKQDANETEKSDDREQLDDNYFLEQRFVEARETNRSSANPGLFYVFGYGSEVEFVCIDTTRVSPDKKRYFEHSKQRAFFEKAFPRAGGDSKWRIPFSHHPVYCAGPHHLNTDGMEEILVPLFQRSEVRLALAGHEHNFQYSKTGGIHYVVSGAGGKLRPESPDHYKEAHTHAWATTGHFMIVEIHGGRAIVPPFTAGPDGEPQPLTGQTPCGEQWEGPIIVER